MESRRESRDSEGTMNPHGRRRPLQNRPEARANGRNHEPTCPKSRQNRPNVAGTRTMLSVGQIYATNSNSHVELATKTVFMKVWFVLPCKGVKTVHIGLK